MQIRDVPFETIDWETVAPTEHKGDRGIVYWRTRQLGDIRVRMVEYAPGYVGDHWCEKGHIFFCLEGELRMERQDGHTAVITAGMSYQAADGAPAHRASSPNGARIFAVD